MERVFPFAPIADQTLQVCYGTRGITNFKIACFIAVYVF